MKHFGAILLAVGLIVGSLVARSHLFGADDKSHHKKQSDIAATIVCAPELASVCNSVAASEPNLTVRIEAVATTEATLVEAGSSNDLNFDAWLAPSDLATIVADQRERELKPEVFVKTTPVLARSPVVMVVWNDRLEVLKTQCPSGDVTWTCIGDLSGEPWVDHGGNGAWGSFTPGYPSPAITATGLAVIAQASSSWFGTTEFASNDFNASGFRPWLAHLENGVVNRPQPPRTPLTEMLTKGPSSFELSGDIEATALSEITGSRSESSLEILYPAPAVTYDVVMVTTNGTDAGERLTTLFTSNEASEAFRNAHWQVDDSEPSDHSSHFNPGVLEALRSLWLEVSR